jgi:rod shape-determining protein MreD
MKYLKVGLLLLITAVAQTTILAWVTIFSVRIDLFLIVVVSFGLLKGRKSGLAIGFIAGLIQDIFVGRFIGLHAVSKMIVGYLLGLMEQKVFKENLFVSVVAVFLGTLMAEFIIWFISLFLFWHYPFLNAVKQVILPSALVNAIFAPLVYSRLYKSRFKI